MNARVCTELVSATCVGIISQMLNLQYKVVSSFSEIKKQAHFR
jgi:hypothetical protein